MPGGGTFTGRGVATRQASWPLLEEEALQVWAHDATAEAGNTYRYRVRIGFFNPIAGRDWFTDQEKGFRDQIILWSPFAQPEKVAQVPPRTLFFPRPTRDPDVRLVQADVFHYQAGMWHNEQFLVRPGLPIGKLQESKEALGAQDAFAATTQQEPDFLDFRTGATLLDVLPESTHWVPLGRTLRNIPTIDILYRDKDGQVQRIGLDKQTWPDDLRKQYAKVVNAIKEQAELQRGGRRTTGGRGTPRAGGPMGALGGGMMP